MKMTRALTLGMAMIISGFTSLADTPVVNTVEDYNKLLPYWGTSWSPGSQSVNGYYPSFYTGFAMRSESPERIHIHLGRGNQTRVSVILDEQTLIDYTFDLAKRYSFYKKMTEGSGAPLNIKPKGANLIPQLSYFNQVIESKNYGILDYVKAANGGAEKPEAMYVKGLHTLMALNPGRVFNLRIDLKSEFAKWKSTMQNMANGDVAKVTSTPAGVVTAINSLVFGRINSVEKPSADVMAKLNAALTAAVTNAPDDQFIPAAYALFTAVTGSKYAIKYVDANGQWQNALACSVASCTLTYPEFTAVYPAGTVMEKTSDEFGNSINSFATPGLWSFVSRGGGREVDNIRNEPYYGFIPKMDFEEIGNGFHNPAVRFWDPSKALKQALGINMAHDTYWAVKRGGVSHGCVRLPAGSVWEMRQILPVEDDKVVKVSYFGNNPQDFDVYDINGDGTPEVMGVEYMISYDLQGTSNLATREGKDMEINAGKKLDFYTTLYGAKNVFTVENDRYIFDNPRISMHSYLDAKKHTIASRVKLNGRYALYEQAYERDKLQMYAIGEVSESKKPLIKLMGRVRGCAPISNKQQCGEAYFDQNVKGAL